MRQAYQVPSERFALQMEQQSDQEECSELGECNVSELWRDDLMEGEEWDCGLQRNCGECCI